MDLHHSQNTGRRDCSHHSSIRSKALATLANHSFHSQCDLSYRRAPFSSKEKDFSLLTHHPLPSMTHHSATMATNLSLALPTHPTSLVQSRRESSLTDTGRKGKKLFVRNVSFHSVKFPVFETLIPTAQFHYHMAITERLPQSWE